MNDKYDSELPSPGEVLSIITQLFCSLMNNMGVRWSAIMAIINDPGKLQNLAEYIIKGCPSLGEDSLEVENQERCELTLDGSYISAEEVNIAVCQNYSPDQFRYIFRNLPSLSDIVSFGRRDSFFLIPGPVVDQTFRDLVANNMVPASSSEHEWYMKGQGFIDADIVRSCRLMVVYVDGYADSTNKSSDEQMLCVEDDEQVPNAAEVLWAMTVLYKVRNYMLFERMRVRTSSIASNGNLVTMGMISARGTSRDPKARIDNHTPNDACVTSLGLARIKFLT